MASLQINKLGLVLILVGLGIVGTAANYIIASRIFDKFTVAMVIEPARTLMTEAWTDSVPQNERAFCVENFTVFESTSKEGITKKYLLVHGVRPARYATATPWRMDGVTCKDTSVPIIHVHTPTTCEKDDIQNCVYGGLMAFFCQPSDTDYHALKATEAPFGVIQCGKDQFVFYYP